MTFPLITPELIAQIEQFQRAFSLVRMEALRNLSGNPYGIEIRPFGSTVATRCLTPLLRGKNRLVGFQAADAPLLSEMLVYFRDDGLRATLSVPHGQMSAGLFRQLTAAGLWSGGSGLVPAIVPDEEHPTSEEVEIRESGLEEKELYLDLFQQAFAHREERHPDYRAFQWVEDTLPGCRRYIAWKEGIPMAMASFPVIEGVGFFGTAGVLPEYRGQGVQRALLGRRLNDARAWGCRLVIGGGSLFSTTHRNFERVGMRLVPLGMGWTDGMV